jgi:molecular chaperone DnaK
LSKEDIERMQKDAEKNAADDAKKRELAEAKNISEQLVYTAEKALKDAADKIPVDVRDGVEGKIAALKSVKDSTDVAVLKKASEELSTEMQKIGQYMNQQGGAQGAGNGAQGAAGTGDAGAAGTSGADAPQGGNVRDADFKEGDGEQKS